MFIASKLSVFAGWLALAPTVGAQAVYLINATGVPEIAVSVSGSALYPRFPQGLYTAGSATDSGTVRYQIQDPRSGRERTLTMAFPPGARQALIVHGDFSLPTAPARGRKRQAAPPNVRLLPLDCARPPGATGLRYRLVNLLPAPLRLVTQPEPLTVAGGGMLTVSGQPAVTTLTVEVSGSVMPVLIAQRRTLRDCDVIFYESGSGPAFIRFFEPSADSDAAAEEE
ncbi:MAG: hypothetical protein LBK71_06620 [Verrucomicrobiales bacterium]|jgi:hypothetical protein|nr:hypothetical protein [Verrucomicrobiales bacterium]